jgi:transglutaminase-like putative cysteine protease
VSASVGVLEAAAGQPPREGARAASRLEGALVGYASFAALGLYGALRWATLMRPEPTTRLLALLGLALALALVGTLPERRGQRLLAALATLAATVAMIPLAGLPAAWIAHARVALIARAIGSGLAALPAALVPYSGFDPALRAVIVIGAGVLLLDGAAVLAFSPGRLSGGRRAVAALPLLVVALLPSALRRPELPYLEGILLFALLICFLVGERLLSRAGAAALVPLAAAAALALALAPGIDPRAPWINFQRLTGSLAGGAGESFDWTQTYGPLRWPSNGRTVLTVRAPRPGYWKAESLDYFNGYGWTSSPAAGQLPAAQAPPLLGVAAAALRRYSETVQVDVGDISAPEVIAPGAPLGPVRGLPGRASEDPATGALRIYPQLRPGESYRLRVYAPDPGPAQLAREPAAYPQQIQQGFLQLQLPAFAAPGLALPRSIVRFEPFGSPRPLAAIDFPGRMPASEVERAVRSSPYGRAFALAQRLAAAAATPYQFVAAVERYLEHGFAYSLNPRPARYPLLAFLFKSRLGYCQQFAGAMALLLRMGGVPARVATGFTTGLRVRSERAYAVSDLDAHAWVEVWFRGYGWVSFDPTPAGPSGAGLPLQGGGSEPPPAPGRSPGAPARVAGGGSSAAPTAGHGRRSRGAAGSGAPWAALLAGVLTLAAALAALAWRWLRSPPDALGELERAFASCGRPLPAGITLAALEQRLRSSPDAAAYVRSLRLERFAQQPAARSRRQRRALRAELAFGGGPLGRLRALWALPPRRATAVEKSHAGPAGAAAPVRRGRAGS